MIRYRLLKDLPLAKAGAIFTKVNDSMCQNGGRYDISLDFFGDEFYVWFEEIEINNKPWEPKSGEKFYFIRGDSRNDVNYFPDRANDYIAIGNCFKTKEDTKKAVKKLKALKRLRDKGFRFEHWSFLHNEQDDFKDIVRISATIDYDAMFDRSALEDLDLLFLRRKNEGD